MHTERSRRVAGAQRKIPGWSASRFTVGLAALMLGLAGRCPAQDSVTDLFQFANLNYDYGRYEAAAQKYTTLLKTAPDHPGAIPAWFRLGDCYRRLNFLDEANQCFETYLLKAPEGEYAAPAALAVARYYFNKDLYPKAVGPFRVALTKLTDPAMKAETRFFLAQALQYSNDKQNARQEYATLLKGPATEFHERAELELAKLLLEEGKTAEALRYFSRLAGAAKDESIRDEANFRAGVLNLESAKPEEAEKLLKQTLEQSKNPTFRQIAQMALMDRAYRRKDYSEVIRLYSLLPLGAKGKAKAQLDMMFANSLRNKNELAQAIRIFGQIEQEFRGSAEGTEAGYRKLLIFHDVKDKDLPKFVDEYVASMRQVDANSHYIDLALLLKAENLYDARLFQGAAEAYSQVRPDKVEKVDPKYASMRLFKMGWAYAESGNSALGIETLGDFVAQWPKDPLAATALVKRGITYYKVEDYRGALQDFTRIVKEYPDSKDLEYAMHQVALLLRFERRVKEMVEAYQALLAKFPNTEVKAEALFWIGGGLFDLKQYKECIEPLQSARDRNPKEYDEKASLRLVFSHFHLKHTDELLKETDRFLILFGEKEELVPVIDYLARQLYERGNYAKAEPYLKRRSDPKNPQKTASDIWRMLANVHMSMSKWQEAVADLAAFLQHNPHVEIRARAMLDQANCHFKLGALEPASKVAGDVLLLIRSGRLNSEARILLGDLELAKGKPDEAVQQYVIVAEFDTDPVMLPKALTRLVTTLEKQGKAEMAAKYHKELQDKFPNHAPGP